MKEILKSLWKFIVEHIWPLLWPIIRDSIQEVAEDIVAWFKTHLRDGLRKRAKEQEEFAQKKSADASQQASVATNEADRIRLAAESEAWKAMVSQLQAQNLTLQKQLDDLLKAGSEYSASRVEAASTKDSLREKVLKLPPPEDVPDKP